MNLASLTVLVFFTAQAPVPDRPDFSGSYTRTSIKGKPKFDKSDRSERRVVQTADEIEVTQTFNGKSTTNKFMLDGRKAPYTSDGGVSGICTAQLKGKSLTLESFVAPRPDPKRPPVLIHQKERWSLSADSKTLTVRTEVEFPNSGLGDFEVVPPSTEIYTRN